MLRIVGFLVVLAVLAGCTGEKTSIPTTAPAQDAPAPAASAMVQKGSLRVSIDTQGAAVSQIYTSGLKGVEMARIKLSATGEDVLVRDLVLDVINGNGNIARVTLLGTGGPVDFIPLIEGKASFYFPPGSEIRVPAYSSRIITVDVDITQVGTTIAGQLVTLGVRDLFAVGAVSGATVSQETPGETPAILMGKTMRIEEVEPVITRHPDSPSGVQVPSTDQTVAMFKVEASGYRDLVFNSLTIEKTGNNHLDENVNLFSLWRNPVMLAKVESKGTTVTFTFPEQLITAGSSLILSVQADTREVRKGASSGQVTFSVKIPGVPGPLAEGGGLSWDYTPLGVGTALYKTQADTYPVEGGVLVY